ncbi:MAG: hypothetical protein CO170_03615 [candidate division SR1 bacterium CG_4_9_14_3_um_filter_40_9]|nr:MAG: hypothetical protein CO170_03615 [candidate division SR1 bacterium CG_4_9_14_3_um_filter_40_9]
MPDIENKNHYSPVMEKNTTVESVIKTYRLIHTYFFTYAIFVVVLIIGVIIFQNILKTNTLTVQTSQVNHEFVIRQKKLIGAFNKQLKQNIENEGVQVEIIEGYISNTGGYIESSNNLARYKGYILPRFFYIQKTVPLQDIAYFSKSDYETRELDYFIQNVLLAKVETNQRQEANTQLPIKGTIIETFDLGCMFKNKFFQAICNQHIEEFLDSFFVYGINRDYEGLKTVFDIIIDDEYKTLLCENMDKYIIYSNDTNAKIEELVARCSTQSVTKFKKLASFIEVQKELDSKQISKSIYNDSEINAYKLLSVQQSIYKDIINNRINTTNILQYLDFLKELLAADKIDAFYKDLSYRFDNKYILPRIENPDNPIAKNRKSDADEIIKQITIVNNGSELLGFKGLAYQIKNHGLLPVQVQNQAQTTSSKDEITLLLNHFSYLKVKETIFSGEDHGPVDILVNGDLIIDDTKEYGKQLKLNTALLLRYQQNGFVVKKIKIENQNTLNAVMKEVLSKAEYSLGEMYEYVAQNLAFYDKASQTDTTDLFCNQIKNKVMADPNIQVNTCTTSNLSVTKSDEDTTIKYVIEFANYAITSISISDQEIQTAINEKLKNISTNEVNFTDIIGDIICYKKPQVSTTEGTDNAIIITEKIKNYLGITIDDIAEKSGRILIAFSVGRIKFIGNYNMTKNIIYPIYFKDVLLNNVPAKIMNFSLSLDDASKTDIYKFISSPSDYIKTISPESYLLYDKFISGE